MALILHMHTVLLGSVWCDRVICALQIWLLLSCIHFASPFCCLNCTFMARHSQGNVKYLSHNSMSIDDC